MKPIISIANILCFAMLLCGVPSAVAQTIMDGRVTMRDVAVSRNNDKLFVSMDIDVSTLDVSTNREVIITPRLTAGADTLDLPAVMVAGRSRYYHHLRNGVQPSDTELYRSGKTSVIKYRTVVPYVAWMGKAVLGAANETCGCCSESLDGGSAPLLALDLEPKHPKKFAPEFIYVRPEAMQKINVLEGSAYIDFPVSRTEIYPDYRRNPVELQKIIATIDAVRNDSDSRIIELTIKGYASPESPYSNNERLAKGRTKSLKNYVQQQYSFPESIISTDYEPEDWAGLERYVASSSLAAKDGILALIRTDMDPAEKEARIKRNYPVDYAFLLKEVYPGLRHSDYAVKYEVRAYTDIDEIKRLIKTQPSKLSLNEMYLAARDMVPGSAEFEETFDIAVRMYPDDPVANLNAANASMQAGDMKRAQRYLDNAGSSPEAGYARGVYAAISGDYDSALRLFVEAERRGVAKATAMIKHINEIK